MISQWIKALDKKSSERSESEIDEIYVNLKKFRIFQRLHPIVLRELCKHACIEFLDKSVFLFKQGDEALNWYAVICGSLDVQISQVNQTGRIQDTVTLCTLGIGTACDDSVLTGRNHSVSAITNEKCTLVRVKREKFRELYEQNLQLIENNENNGSIGDLNYSFSTSLPSKLPIRSYSQSCSSISGRQSTSPEQSRSNLLGVGFRETNSGEILGVCGSSRNSFSSQNTEPHLLTDQKFRHHSEGQIDKLDQSMNQLFHQNQSCSSTNLKSNFNQPLSNLPTLNNLEQSNNYPSQQQQPINQIAETKKDAFSRRKSFHRSTIRRSSYRTVYSGGFEESDINSTVLRVAKVLRTLIQYKASYLIRDRCLESPVNYESIADANNNKTYSSFPPAQQQTHREIFTNCMIGSEMCDWLLSISSNTTLKLHSRFQAASMWQVLIEENVLKMVPNRLSYESGNQGNFFEDKYLFYRFCFDYPNDSTEDNQRAIESFQNETNSISIEKAEAEILHCLQLLNKLGPSAMFRRSLQKKPEERTPDEIDLIYMQLMHVKPLSSLSNSIRQELAKVVQYELHRKCGSIVFNQGEQGTSWYIILKGSVNVVILGKGIVCTLNEMDDFGKLAVINETVRAATIITNEDNCQFLKVLKPHFDKIMRDAEANTVRLKEHGNEVLVLQKMATKIDDETDKDGQIKTSFKYVVMAGTPDKILEYLIETRIDVTQDSEYLLNNCLLDRNAELLMSRGSLLYNVFDSSLTASDTFLEDFLLTYQIYLSNFTLCKFLLKYYKIDHHSTGLNNNQSKSDQQQKNDSKSNTSIPANKIEFILLNKRKVIRFIKIWLQVAKEPFLNDNHIVNFLNEINKLLEEDSIKYHPQLNEEIFLFNQILECEQVYREEMESRGVKKWKSDTQGPIRRLSINGVTCNLINTKSTAKPTIPPLTRTNSLINKNIFSSLANMNNRNSIAALTNTLTSPFNAIAANAQTLNLNASKQPTPESEFFKINRRINVIRPKDEMISRIYCADHTYTTLCIPVDSTAQVIKLSAAEKLGLINKINTSDENLQSNQKKDKQNNSAEFILVEIKSNGERVLFKDTEVNVRALSVNGRIFVCLIDHLDSLTPLPEQLGPTISSFHILEEFTEVQLAYYLTYYSWNLFTNVHEVFGRHNFSQITANLDVFLKHFNEVQYWVVTEILLQNNLAKRVHLLKKFIKVASICKDFKNLNTFFAIVIGLNNIAVSRLTQTWEKISNKLKRFLANFESLIDPSRNHRKYRVFLSKLQAPIIPFTPLLLKDMTFAHEGNLTFIGKGMINFEKMHMLSQTLRVIKYCKSKPLNLENITLTNISNSSNTTLTPQFKNALVKIDAYIRDLKVIDNQRVLNQLSHRIEHRK